MSERDLLFCENKNKGVINRKRKDLNKYKKDFITDRDISTLEEAVKDADVFLGLSVEVL